MTLQKLLMSAVRDHSNCEAVAAQTGRLLATAASLDYVLLLATDAANVAIPPQDAQRAMSAGFSRAVDDALLLLRALLPPANAEAQAFVRDGLRTVQATITREGLATDARAFALIGLAADMYS